MGETGVAALHEKLCDSNGLQMGPYVGIQS